MRVFGWADRRSSLVRSAAFGGLLLFSEGWSGCAGAADASFAGGLDRGAPWNRFGAIAPLPRLDSGGRDVAGDSPVSLASADYDEDGVPDLVTGFALGPANGSGGRVEMRRGRLSAVFPSSAIERSSALPPFDGVSIRIDLAAPPDFLAAGDFDGDSHWDVLAASRSSKELALLRGDGHGAFSEPEAVRLGGPFVCGAAGEVNRRDGLTDLAVVVAVGGGSRLLVFEGGEGALRHAPEAFDFPEPVGAVLIADVDRDHRYDVVLGGRDALTIVAGRDRRLSEDPARRPAVSEPEIVRLPSESAVRALAFGDFVGDQLPEVALLGEDRTLSFWDGDRNHAAVRSSVTVPYAASVMARLRSGSVPTDELAILAPSERKILVVSREGDAISARERSAAAPGVAQRPFELETSGPPVALLPMRLGVDALDDLVVAAGRNVVIVPTVSAVTFTVNSNGDGADSNTADGVCNNGSGQCTLRAAIQQANATAGADTIVFSIGSGIVTIAPASAFPTITEAVTIDGTTQPGYALGAPVVELNGAGAGVFARGFYVTGGSSTIRGLTINRFSAEGIWLDTNGGNKVESCWLGLNNIGSAGLGGGPVTVYPGSNTIGGTTSAARNVISGNSTGIRLFCATASTTGNVVSGNYVGTNPAGTSAIPNSNDGIRVGRCNGATIGGTVAGSLNLVSGTSTLGSEGVAIELVPGYSTTDNLVQGNLIGTSANGAAAIPNAGGGISIDAAGNQVGGTVLAARNVISGNGDNGIEGNGDDSRIQGNFIGTTAGGNVALPNTGSGLNLAGSDTLVGGSISGSRNVISGNGSYGFLLSDASSTGFRVQGNFIGTDAAGSAPLGNGSDGIRISPATGALVGGPGGAANRIASNAGYGVALGLQNSNTVSQCSISGNSLEAIALLGVGPNDPGDLDGGSNDGQNHPVLSAVRVCASGTTIDGSLSSTPSANYTLEFFSSSTCPSGRSQAETFLGSAAVSTDVNGNAPFSVSFPTAVAAGRFLSATATSSTANTSMLSACVLLASPLVVLESVSLTDSGGNGNGRPDPNECVSLQVTLRNTGSLTASGISGVLVSLMPNVTVTQPASAFPPIPAGSTGVSSIRFGLSLGAGYTCGQTLDLALDVTTSAGVCRIPVRVPGSGATASPVTLAWGGSSVAIPDNDPAGASMTLNLSSVFQSPVKVRVFLKVTHPYDGDLRISLVGPDGTTVQLANNRGGTGDNFGTDCLASVNDTIFDDAAASAISAGTAPFVGSFRPESPLLVFRGKPSSGFIGSWTLHVVDAASSDVGTIDCWTLEVTPASCTAGSGGCTTLPGEAAPLNFVPGSETSLQWGAAANATGYNLYQGIPADLPQTTNGLTDSCRIYSGASPTSGGVATTVPATGSFLWYLVRAVSDAGNGPAGNSSSGPIVLDSWGTCP